MLGIRKIYPSSAINASCLLRLHQPTHTSGTGTAPKEVLLAAIGDNVEVFDVTPEESKCSSSGGEDPLFTFTPRRHTFLVGANVLLMIPLPNQLFLIWTRTLELVLVRYQANLAPPADLAADLDRAGGAEPLWQPGWRDWCVCGRLRLADRPKPSQVKVRQWMPRDEPQLLVLPEEGGTWVAVVGHLFVGVAHHFFIQMPENGEGSLAAQDVCWPPPPTFRYLYSPLNAPDPKTGSSEMFLLQGPYSGTAPGSGLGVVTSAHIPDAPDPDAAAAGAPAPTPLYDLIDEDLLHVLPVEELVKRAQLKAKEAEARESHAMAKPKKKHPARAAALVFHDMTQADTLMSLPFSTKEGRRIVVDIPNSAPNLPYWRMHVYHRPYLAPQSESWKWKCPRRPGIMYHSVSFPVDTATGKERCMTTYFSRTSSDDSTVVEEAQTIDIINMTDIWTTQPVDRGDVTPEADTCLQLRTGKSVRDALLVLPRWADQDNLSSSSMIWIITEDGTLERMTLPPLGEPPAPRKMQSGADVGLPKDFHPARFLAVGARDTDAYQAKYTSRYAMITDDVSSVYMLDMHERKVVGALVGDGALASACGGPAGTSDLFVAHANGTVRRLTPSVPVPLQAAAPIPVAAGAEGTAWPQPIRFVQPLLPSTGEGTETEAESGETLRVVVAPEEGPAALLPHDGCCDEEPTLCAAQCNRRRTCAAAEASAPTGGILVRCTKRALVVGEATRPSHVLPLPCEAICASVTVATVEGKDEDTVFVLAVLTTGELALVTNHMLGSCSSRIDGGSDAETCGPWSVSRLPAPAAARATGVTVCGVACVRANADATHLAVALGSWDGHMCVLSLVMDKSTASWRVGDPPAGTKDASPWSTPSTAGTEASAQCLVLLHPGTAARKSDLAPAALQLVAAPPIGNTLLWVVRSSHDVVSILSVTVSGDETCDAVSVAMSAAWRPLVYTAKDVPTESADERAVVMAMALGPLSVFNTARGESVATAALGDGTRSGVLLLHGRLLSFLFFSTTVLQGEAAPAVVTEQLRVHLEEAAAIAPQEWLAGCATIDTHATGSLVGSNMTMYLVGPDTVCAATVPREVMEFQWLRQPLAMSEGSAIKEGLGATAAKDTAEDAVSEEMEMRVRTPPSYIVTASSDAQLTTLGGCDCIAPSSCDCGLPHPETFLSHMVYCAPADTVLGFLNREAAGRDSVVVALTGDTLAPVATTTTPGRTVLCAQTMPFYPSLPDTAPSNGPQDLVLVGTEGCQGGKTRPAILAVLPNPLRVVETYVFAEVEPGEGVTDIAIHRSRRRVRPRRSCGSGNQQRAVARVQREREEEEILVAACCGKTVQVFRLVGYLLKPIAEYTNACHCFTVSFCLPCLAVGCGTGGHLYLLLKRDHQDTSTEDGTADNDASGQLLHEDKPRRTRGTTTAVDSLSDEDEEDESSEGEEATVGVHVTTQEKDAAGTRDDDEKTKPGESAQRRRRPRVAPLHGSPQVRMRLFPVAFAPSLTAPPVAQLGYRGTQAIHTDADGSVVFTRVDLLLGKPSGEAGLIGTKKADCTADIYHCVRLPSPATTVTQAASSNTGDGHAALWRRVRRQLRWSGECVVLRNSNPRSDGTGPMRVLLPCKDGGLFMMQELPWALGLLLMRLEQTYTDQLGAFLAPAKALAGGDAAGRPRTLYAGATRPGTGSSRTVQSVFYGTPFCVATALQNVHRTLRRQAVLSIDALEELLRVWRSGCGATTPQTAEDRAFCISTELARVLREAYGDDVTLEDCAEACAAW